MCWYNFSTPNGRVWSMARLLGALSLLVTIACEDSKVPTSPAAPAMAGARPEAAELVDNNFYDVQVGTDGNSLTVYFKYSGPIIPILTVGTGPDVFATQKGYVGAQKQSNGYWIARLGGLLPDKQYWFRIDNLAKTYYGTAKTKRRKVTVDIDSVRVVYDGDPGYNCGDLIFYIRYQALAEDYPYIYPAAAPLHHYTNWHCVHSGNTVKLSDTEGRTWSVGWEGEYASLLLGGMDSDSCSAFTTDCGQFGWSPKYEYPVVNPGTSKVVLTSQPYNDLELIWYAKLIVEYVP